MPTLKSLFTALCLTLPLISHADGHHNNGEQRQHKGKTQVWHGATEQWACPEDFFERELVRLKGPTYGTRTSDNYPEYNKVQEWETLIDQLPDGRVCPMVFFHNRWRRLPDVLALDDNLRNYGGCRDVFKS